MDEKERVIVLSRPISHEELASTFRKEFRAHDLAGFLTWVEMGVAYGTISRNTQGEYFQVVQVDCDDRAVLAKYVAREKKKSNLTTSLFDYCIGGGDKNDE